MGVRFVVKLGAIFANLSCCVSCTTAGISSKQEISTSHIFICDHCAGTFDHFTIAKYPLVDAYNEIARTQKNKITATFKIDYNATTYIYIYIYLILGGITHPSRNNPQYVGWVDSRGKC